MDPVSKAFHVIACADPAIDTQQMTDAQMLDYITARDVSVLPIKTGQRATRFVLRPITQSEMLGYVMQGATDAEKHARAFRASVDSVQGAWIDGRQQADAWAPADRRAPMTSAECELFSLAEILDIGGVAWTRSFLGQRIAPRYALPPLLHAFMVGLPYRYAGQNDAATSSNEANATPASTAPDGQAVDVLYESPTVARATAENIHPVA